MVFLFDNHDFQKKGYPCHFTHLPMFIMSYAPVHRISLTMIENLSDAKLQCHFKNVSCSFVVKALEKEYLVVAQ